VLKYSVYGMCIYIYAYICLYMYTQSQQSFVYMKSKNIQLSNYVEPNPFER
jgi:hypothetical protein